jgi:hypothetical protein
MAKKRMTQTLLAAFLVISAFAALSIKKKE